MSQEFLNGRITEKAQQAMSLLCEIRSFNTNKMSELYPMYAEDLDRAAVALQAIADALRAADRKDNCT